MTRPDRLIVRVCRARAARAPLPLPQYATDGAAGMDLRADIESEIRLQPGERCSIPCGIAVELETGWEAQIRPRSGLALRDGVTLLNAPGTIDSDYRGEIRVVLINLGDREVCVRRGDRIAQMVVAPVVRVEWDLRETLSASGRGAGGFGHTGRA